MLAGCRSTAAAVETLLAEEFLLEEFVPAAGEGRRATRRSDREWARSSFVVVEAFWSACRAEGWVSRGGGVTAEEGPIAGGDGEGGEEREAAAPKVFSKGRGEEEVWGGEFDCEEVNGGRGGEVLASKDQVAEGVRSLSERTEAKAPHPNLA